MVRMAAYESTEAGKIDSVGSSAQPEELSKENEDCESGSRKRLYVVPSSFVIHTYSWIQLNPVLNSLYSFYRHKVTMFKVTISCVAIRLQQEI